MAFRVIYLHVGICMLIVPTTLDGLLGRDTNTDQNSQEAESEVKLLSRVLEAEKKWWHRKHRRRRTLAILKRNNKSNIGRSSDRKHERSRELMVGNELVERHIRDCKKRIEIIMLKDDDKNKRPKACYLRNMDDKLYSFSCLGNGGTLKQTFIVAEEVVNKDFLSEDGPDSVCRDIPMFKTVTTNNEDQDDTSSRRGLNVSKKSTCHSSCGLVCYGWWNCPWECTTNCS